ncbi:MAG: hypothetical protein ACFNL4_05770 [Corynebacterium matruchotii]|uniref:hypothetical protein n=1 Tax=Corynebacterium matruchotii TaxID=43768 RepID=UPI0036230329
MPRPLTRPRGAAGDWSLGVGRRLARPARQPGEAAGDGSQPPAAIPQAGYGIAAAPRRVSCGPNAATYVGPRPAYTPTPRHMPVAGD